MRWFDVDKQGLAKLLEQRGVTFALYELVQNAWDTNASRVEVILDPVPGRAFASVMVIDNNPEGFKNLTHAWTLFAESEKKGDPAKRGRFNLGEKLVLALCESATITSTTGCVRFDATGRHRTKSRRTEGTAFVATMRMKRDQLSEAAKAMRLLIPPSGVVSTFNGDVLPERPAVGQIEVTLPTVVADEEGVLRPTRRKTLITLHEPLPGETAMIYEMGIPVVETGDRWHVNVHQKMPVNLDRDNVPPSYLRQVRAAALNAMSAKLDGEAAKERWVTDALSHPSADHAAVTTVIERRYGQKRVIYDPSDPEGTKIAVSKGYAVIPAGAFDKEAWANIKAAGAALPAGQVTPSPKPFQPGGDPLKLIEREDWTDQMAGFSDWVRTVSHHVAEEPSLEVEFTRDAGWGMVGCMGPGVKRNSRLIVNLSRLSLDHTEETLAFVIHELAHIRVADHLSNEFHEECCRLGARLTLFALTSPDIARPVW